MDAPFLQAQHYHDRAQALRKLAAAEDDARRRENLRQIADSYDRLCRNLMSAAKAALKGQR